MLACGRPEEAILFRVLLEGDWWGTLVEDGVPSLPGLIIQLGKTVRSSDPGGII